MLGGAVVGLIAAILITFVMALVDGQAQGMSAGSCVLYGCVLTVLLSQMAGFSGMAVGAGMGALAGGIVHLVRDPARTR
jgi:NhaP-type Na+/H+ or K+/H+ antiporter